MKILGLYNNNCTLELFQWLSEQGHNIVLNTERLNVSWCREQNFDLTVSYTYRYILTGKIIQALENNVVNLHNSLLPWNRGADPNIWSIAENTPRGVSLHYMDTGLDKGYVIAQDIIPAPLDEDTLRTTYDELDRAAKALFKKAFLYYEFWPSLKKKCLGRGSYHSLENGQRIKEVINSYDLSIAGFRKLMPPGTYK